MRTLQRKFRTTLLAQFIHPTTAVKASFGGLHLHLKVGGLEATKSDINVLATNLESVSNCAFSQDNQHDAASNSFHSRLHWSRYVIIDDDEIKAYISFCTTILITKRGDTIMFTISTEQSQQIKTKGGDEIQLPVEGEVYLWLVLEENI